MLVPPLVIPPASLPHTPERCQIPNCDRCRQISRAAVLSSAGKLTASPRLLARDRFLTRSERLNLGLSNPAYLAAPSWGDDFAPRGADLAYVPSRVSSFLGARLGAVGESVAVVREVPPAQLHLHVKPSRVQVSFSDAMTDHLRQLSGSGGRRGVITELSEASRNRLADIAVELTEVGKIPTDIVTLTCPANWQDIYMVGDVDKEGNCSDMGGKLFKKHIDTFRKRLTRFFNRHGIFAFSALWFLEFQKRGAPHVHFILFDVDMTPEIRRYMRNWLGRAWSDIVGNPDDREREKHRRVGTQVSRMRKPHFGYAAKYASKAEQKEVPVGFENVGRFWGVWNYKADKGVYLTIDYSHLNDDDTAFIRKIMVSTLATIADKSQSYMMNKLQKVFSVLRDGLKFRFGFAVYGGAAGRALLSALE